MKYSCSIIRDLLPSYIDGLTSEETNRIVGEHLKECLNCQTVYNEMKNQGQQVENDDIDYMKKIKKYHKKKILIITLSIVFLVTFFVTTKNYYIPYEIYPDYSLEVGKQEDNICFFTVYSQEKDSYDFKNHKLVKDDYGNYHIVMYGTEALSNNTNHSYSGEVRLDELDGLLYVGDKYIDSTGYQYNSSIVNMINSRISHVGDNSGVSKLLKIAFDQLELQTGQSFEYDAFSIQTEKEPYSITVEFDYTLDDSDKKLIVEELKNVLSCIDNCNLAYIKDESTSLEVKYDKKVNTYEDYKNMPEKELMSQLDKVFPQGITDELHKNAFLLKNRYDDEILLSLGNAKDNPSLRLDFVYIDEELMQYVSKEYGFIEDDVASQRINIEEAKQLAIKFSKVCCQKEINDLEVSKPLSGYEMDDYVTLKDEDGHIYLVSLRQNYVMKYNNAKYE